MSAEELTDELDKLEIAPILQTLKMAEENIPLQLNPFYDGLKTYTSSETTLEHHAATAPRLPPNCRRCRLRRLSESVLDDYKVSTAQLAGDCDGIWNTRSTPRLQRTSLKKSATGTNSSGNGKKLIIREPVLRALQTCCARRKIAVDDFNVSASGATAANSSSTVSQMANASEKGITDFRDLIEECQTLLEHDVQFNSGRLNQLTLGNKNFTTMRRSTGALKKRNEHGLISDSGGCRLSRTLPTPSSSASLSNLRSTSPLLLNEFNSLSTGSVNAAKINNNCNNSGTSCSQQAGNANNSTAAATTATNATGDDVTIDELASYFDTLVHIPKKMSAMAEMMYI